jgi:1-aminocyclopropane-1-carboxylate deaminase/D-cysteine desulfhydrase-like pyridoxal-dependent ACC family enzyme
MLWNLTSRIHPLNGFPSKDISCYVKREDELSCGISGTKIRKYAGLIPFMLQNEIKHLVIIAGAQSNNLLAALQIARELNLAVSVFLLKPKTEKIQGNFKLSRLFLCSEEIHWVERADWAYVDELATQYALTLNQPNFVLAEGASVPEAFEGAMSLADDIVRNEKQLGLNFDHLFIDAGTGFSAAALIHRLTVVKHPGIVHVLLLADVEELFIHKMSLWSGGAKHTNYRCFYPRTARSFGSVNNTVREEIKRTAREEGILTDPIYSAKLFNAARHYIAEQALNGAALLIHSGGALTLSGFDL